MTLVDVGGQAYYQCGESWYQKVYSGGEVSYLAVAPPAGP
jgi:hypothetical protein